MNIGVVGGGTMGNGIAHVFAIHNYNVTLVDLNSDILKKSFSIIGSNMARQVKKGIINNFQMENSLNNISFSSNINDLHDSILVVEAIKEDLLVKSNLFIQLDKVCNNNTILASNTSSISINKLSQSIGRKDKIIGMHFMNPVPVMKLVEIIKGNATSNNTLDFIINISKEINKIPIMCNDSPGFVSNRILMPMINEAAYTYMEGVADVESIDQIMKLGMGHPMGPLKLADLIGIDICVNIMQVLLDGFKNKKYNICPLLIDMVNNGKLGVKSGEGFYKYN
tara:strand:- start:5802 stop:6644 length:843 start_codon:yes stop_codon:yes gene_type:complete